MVKIVKKYNENFTIVHNTLFTVNEQLPDEMKLSFKAMGIFIFLWHLPSDWTFHESELIKHGKEQLTAFRHGREELERLGFIEKKRARNNKGQLLDYEWVLNDNPTLDNLKQDNPTLGYPTLGNPILDNQQLQSTKDTKDELDKVRSSGDDFVNENPVENKAITAYEKLWGFPNAIALQDLTEWIDFYSDELVTYAIQIAGRNNVTSRGAYKYLDKVLTAWKNENVTTVEAAKKQNEEHNNRIDREFKSRKSYNKRPNIKETLPDWAKDDYKPKEYKQSNKHSRDELKKKIANLQNNRHDNSSNQNDTTKDYTREELEERLNKFKEKRNNE